MRERMLTVAGNEKIADAVYHMTLEDTESIDGRPGQFVNIRLEGRFLRRPISIFDLNGNRLEIIFKAVGGGTAQMARMQPGTVLNVLTGLGNGYDPDRAGRDPLLIGGGVGVPPLYYLARVLRANGCRVQAVLGFNRRTDAFALEDFRKLGCEVAVTTVDGSLGQQGLVTDALPREYSYVYTCGPEPMLRSVFRAIRTGGQFSFEERMGCGFGACMGCSCRTVTGSKRICREGPVLDKEEILWEN